MANKSFWGNVWEGLKVFFGIIAAAIAAFFIVETVQKVKSVIGIIKGQDGDPWRHYSLNSIVIKTSYGDKIVDLPIGVKYTDITAVQYLNTADQAIIQISGGVNRK